MVEIESIGIAPLNIRVRNLAIHRTFVDTLRRTLKHVLSWPLESRADMKGFAMILLRVVEEVVSVILEWKAVRQIVLGRNDQPLNRGWDVKDMDYQRAVKEIYENPYGASLDSIDNSRDQILGTSIKEICRQFPENYRILHVEPVFRDNLVHKFQRRQNQLYEVLISPLL